MFDPTDWYEADAADRLVRLKSAVTCPPIPRDFAGSMSNA